VSASDLRDFRKWLETSKPGSEFCYHISDEPRNTALFDAAREAADDGLVALFQKRLDPRTPHSPVLFLYCVRRLSEDAWALLDAASKGAIHV
jgi:hypothetical protein